MKAMIFAAGLGTRFKPFTEKHPKALAVINHKSLLQRNIEYLQQYNITEVVVNVHHFGDQIIEAIEKNKGWGSNVVVSNEKDEVLETGGGLVKAQHLLKSNDAFLTINVDILSNLNIQHLINFYNNHSTLIALAVTDRLTSRYFLFSQQNQLSGWRNTKTSEEKIVLPQNHYMQKAYSGIAIFNPSIFSLIRQKGKFSLTEMYLDLAKTQAILGYDHSSDIILDVGNIEATKTAEKYFQ